MGLPFSGHSGEMQGFPRQHCVAAAGSGSRTLKQKEAAPTSWQALCEMHSGEMHGNSTPGGEGGKPLNPHRGPQWFLPRHQPDMHSVYEIKFRVGTNFLL